MIKLLKLNIQMKAILYLLLFFSPLKVLGQMVGGREIDKEPVIQYIVVHINDVSKVSNGGKKVEFRFHAHVQYGQDMSTPGATANEIIIDGEPKVFNSAVQVFNYLATFGWEYVEQMPKSQYALYDSYLFRRRD